MSDINTRANQPYKIAMLLLPGFNAAAAFAFLDPFRAANYIRGDAAYQWAFLSLDGQAITASNDAIIGKTQAISSDSTDFDLTVINASWAPERFQDAPLKNWLQKVAKRGSALAAIDTGAFVLAYCGLLANRRATVHYEHMAAFKELFPGIMLEEVLYVIDEDRITCSGGAAAADMALRLIQKHHGLELANAAAIYTFKDRHRIGNEPQVQHNPEPMGYTMPQKLREAIILMERNLEEPLSPIEIARYLSISQRQLQRILRKIPG